MKKMEILMIFLFIIIFLIFIMWIAWYELRYVDYPETNILSYRLLENFSNKNVSLITDEKDDEKINEFKKILNVKTHNKIDTDIIIFIEPFPILKKCCIENKKIYFFSQKTSIKNVICISDEIYEHDNSFINIINKDIDCKNKNPEYILKKTFDDILCHYDDDELIFIIKDLSKINHIVNKEFRCEALRHKKQEWYAIKKKYLKPLCTRSLLDWNNFDDRITSKLKKVDNFHIVEFD